MTRICEINFCRAESRSFAEPNQFSLENFMINRSCLKLAMFVFLVGAIFCCRSELYAQATSGTIIGRVTDVQEAGVPLASVTAKNENTGLTQTVQTSDNGDYALVNLPPGLYTVTVAKDGFSTAVSSGNKLEIGQKAQLDIQISVGAVSETVDVSAEAQLLQTQTTETSQVVETKSISDLPLLGRDFLNLTLLSPGVVNGQGGNQLNIAVNGQREFSNSVVVDGIEVTGNRNNDTGLSPSVDSVQEFRIQTSAYAAEYGKASGASVLIQTKPGTNDFRGSLYEFFRPTATAARPFFAQRRGDLQQHNFGGTIGGPIVKDKLFFFFSYEGRRTRDSFNFLDSVPPIGQIRFLPNGDADLSGLRDPITGNQVPIFDPAYYAANYTSRRFAGNIIPANRVSPAGRAILQQLFPSPTTSGIPGTFGYYGNFPASQIYRYNSDKIEPKIDFNISDKDRLSFSYKYIPFNYLTGDRFAGRIPVEGGSTDTADNGDSVNQVFSVTETHIFSSSLVNEFRFGYVRFKFDQDDLIADQNAATSLGIRNINLPNFPQTGGLPNIQLGTGYTTGGSTYKPLAFLDSNFQISDNVTKQWGSHSLKGGIDIRYKNAKPTFSLLPTGYFYFSGAYASLTADQNYCNYNYTPCPETPETGFVDYSAFYGNGGSDIADLLLGLPSIVQVGLQLTDPRTKSHEYSFYLQDSWQVNRRLVFNYGGRYEYQSPYTEKDNNLSNFDPATRTILLAGRGGNSESLINPDKNNFMPRLGLAYKVTDKTVLRAGFGIFYTPENDARSDVLTKNYPFATRQDFTNDFLNGFNYNLDTGVPRQTAINIPNGASSISALTIPNAGNQSFFAVDPNFNTGEVKLFNVVLQQELLSNFTVEAGYVGSRSRDLPYAIGNINRNGRISNQLGRIEAQYSIGRANYDSLQIKADKRFSKGYNFFAAYTLGKCLDNGPAPFNLGRNNQSPQDPFNLENERAVCGYDVRHNFTGSFIYELPIGKGRQFLGDSNAVVDAILGGWQINGIVTMRSGLPVNVIRNSADGTSFRPNLVGDPTVANPTIDNYINLAAFSTAGLGAGTTASPFLPGNAGRNLLRGPGYANLDMSLFKNFSLAALREGMNFQLRFEFFNVTNTPHFGNPNAVLGQGNFGKITGTVGNPRIVQFAGKFSF